MNKSRSKSKKLIRTLDIVGTFYLVILSIGCMIIEDATILFTYYILIGFIFKIVQMKLTHILWI